MARCILAINIGIIIKPIAYLFFLVSKNFSMKYIVNINSINVINWALAHIYGCNKYNVPIVKINDIELFFSSFTFA